MYPFLLESSQLDTSMKQFVIDLCRIALGLNPTEGIGLLQGMYGRHADSRKACTPSSQFYNSFQEKHTCNVHSLFLLIYYVRTYIQNA
jgi:hypothetical protein